MNSEELTAAVESLAKLEHHYKSQYEDYLTKALAAKANLDRLEPLLKDLSSQLSLYPQQQESFLEFEPDEESLTGSREQLELDWMGTLVEDTEPSTEPDTSDEKTENQEISHREFVRLSSQVMPILQSIFVQDVGKKLHLSYLHKIINQKTDFGLSQDTVELFLDKAIALGYCDRDIYDKNCYYSVPDDKALVEEAFSNNPYKRNFERKTTNEEVKETQQPNQEASLTLTKPLHNLPPSPRVKMTIPDTIMGYIIEYQPDTFTVKDVVNYLYSETEQASWSKTQVRQVNTSISNILWGSKEKQWERIQPGVYRPLRPFQDDSNSVTEPETTAFSSDPQERTNEDARPQQQESVTLTNPNHNLPPSPKVKIKMLDTLFGYIEECQPKNFTPSDVVNYLYSDGEQNQWTETQAGKIFKAIAEALHYYSKQKKWQRVRARVYRPISYN